jgi:hypothetical protein
MRTVKEIWKWLQKYSWVIALISGAININKEFKIGSIVNNMWNLIQNIPNYLDKLTVIPFIFIVFSGITIYSFIRYLCDLYKRHIPIGLLKSLLTILELRKEYSTKPEIMFKPKIRIIFRNDTLRKLHIQSVTIVDENIPLQQGHPRELKLRTEKVKGGWKSNQWSDESNKIQVDQDQAFSTWICPNKELSEIEFLQAKVDKQFGTLIFKIDGYNEDWKVQI